MKDLPEAEVVHPTLMADLIEEALKSTLVAVLGLDIQVALHLPVVDKSKDVLGVC